MTRSGKRWLILTAYVCLLLRPTANCASALIVSEDEIESAFLFNFAKFTEWPPESFPTAASPIVICVLGDKPFAATLQRVVNGETISGRKTIIKDVDESTGFRKCHVGFIPASNKQARSEILAPLANATVLTVGQDEGFAHHGGMIRLYILNGRARFEINPAAARRAGLHISSSLLAFATIVKDVAPESERP